jgi:hypothetical protein
LLLKLQESSTFFIAFSIPEILPANTLKSFKAWVNREAAAEVWVLVAEIWERRAA